MTANGSGRSNRVAPDGSTHALASRGLLWDKRGRLLDTHGEPVRHCQGRHWIICRLECQGRQRTQWRPNRLTELYFLDEPTALAAGHRPCGECRYHDYKRFKQAWATAHPGGPSGAEAIDRRPHDYHLGTDGHRTHLAALASLPDGTIIEHEDAFWTVRATLIHAWPFAGTAPAGSSRASATS